MGLLDDPRVVVFGAAAGAVLGTVATNALINAVENNSVVGKAGLRLAASGGRLVKGIMVWPDVQNGVYNKFMFPMNPESIHESVNPKWAESTVPGQNRPLYQFIAGGPRELTFKLNFFYENRARDLIAGQVELLRGLTERPSTSTMGVTGPPALYFYFGQLYRGERFIVTKFDVDYKEMFDPISLLPLRAEVGLTLSEAPDTRNIGNPKVRFRDTIGNAGSILTSMGF